MRYAFLILSVSLMGCEAPANLPAVVDASVTDAELFPPDDVLARGTLATGAPCTEGDCARGACVHGVCSPLCARDTDCGADERCVGRGGAGRCSVVCHSAADCAAGLVCAVDGPDVGFCVAPGRGTAGAACDSREACASWFCTAGQCLGACDEGACADGFRCLPLHTQSVCTPTGPSLRETRCANGTACASGVCRGGRCSDVCPDVDCGDDRICVRWSTVDLCERRCARSADCGDTGVCLLQGSQRLCATRGATPDDGPCVADVDCASGSCGQGTCARQCAADPNVCPTGSACVTDLSGTVCRPAGPAPVGSRCDRHTACASGVCGAGICTADCADGAPCPLGSHCTAFANGDFCFPDCRVDAECPGVAFCDRGFGEGRTCFWRGAGEPGDPCGGHRSCRSGHCANGHCLVVCDAGQPCPAGTRCVDADTANVCTQVPLPLGAACHTEDACDPALLCLAGRCVNSCESGCGADTHCVEGWCRPRCQTHAECRGDSACDGLETRVCVNTGPGEAGAPCQRAGACESGLCLDGQCRSPCGQCTDGQACVDLGGRDFCLEVGPGAVATPCDRHDECGSGLCIGRRCVGPCGDADECAPGTACERVFGARRCVGTCAPADDLCEPRGVCHLDRRAAMGRCVAPNVGGGVGDPCQASADCGPETIGCRVGADGLRCRAPCALWTRDACVEEAVCAATRITDRAGACVPPGTTEDLGLCVEDGACASGWCVDGYLDGRCGRRCRVDAHCPDGLCVDIARNPAAPFWICAPGCSEDSECAAPLRCRHDLAGRAACY